MTVLESDAGAADAVAIIVTYNSARTIGGLLESLDASTSALRVVVVDNGSIDETLRVVERFPAVTAIATGANLGYSGGINIGRRFVPDGEPIAILNPDLVVEPDTIGRLLAVIRGDATIGIAAPQLRELSSGARFDSLRRRPSVRGALGESLFGNHWHRRPSWLAETLRRDDEYASARDVAWAGGAALLVSAACDRAVGEWDARTFFLYAEETDYAQRAHAAGFRVRFEPSAIAHHVGSGSGQSAELVALLSVNRIRHFGRSHGRMHTGLFRAAVATQHALRLHDPRHRFALPVVVRRSRWNRLPAADPAPPPWAATGSEPLPHRGAA